MKKREFRTKKEYRAHVRAKLAGGVVNNANGDWVSSSACDDKVRQRAEKIAERMS